MDLGQHVISLLFSMLSRFVIAFFQGACVLLISWLQSPPSDFGAPKNKICLSFYFYPFYLPSSDDTRCHDLIFFNIESAFPFSSFTLIKRLFSYSSPSSIRVVSSVYLRLLIFLLVNLIPACESLSPACHMMYFAYKSNKQCDIIQP